MKRIGIAALSAASLLAAGAATAAAPQWNYGQIGYIQGDGFEDSGESDGFTIDASVGFLNNWHFQLGYQDGTINDSFGDTDFDGYKATLGFHQAISSTGNTELVVNANYFDLTYDEDGTSADIDTDGYGLGFGLRSMISDKVELEGMINWTKGTVDPDFASSEDYTNTSLQVGGRYHWIPSLSTGITLYVNGNNDAVSFFGGDTAVFDVRYSFGTGF
ncbi:MAG: hypothetical protein R3F24_02805 [Gammaproteobacteria bacterium]